MDFCPGCSNMCPRGETCCDKGEAYFASLAIKEKQENQESDDESNEESRIFLISDLHLNHSNIIKYCNRPFNSVEEMNQTIIDNWNNTVSENDIVYFLGDFCLGGRDLILHFAKQLKGHKYIIKGNHDYATKFFIEAGFEVLPNNYILEYKGHSILLSHRPQLGTKMFNVHGHIHDLTQEGDLYYNVSVEQLNYTPIELDEVIKHDPTFKA